MSKMFAVSKIVVPGMHRWANAPEEYSYLSSPHRHLFYIRCYMSVDQPDRAVEFISMGEQVKKFLYDTFNNIDGKLLFGSLSCEQIATQILNKFRFNIVSVYEDDENGAEFIA